MIFCRKKQRTNAKSGRTKVADWQDVGVEKLRDERLLIGCARVEISQFLRTDFIDVYDRPNEVRLCFSITSHGICLSQIISLGQSNL